MFEEDPVGMKGNIAPCNIMPTVVLLFLEPRKDMKIGLRVRSTMGGLFLSLKSLGEVSASFLLL
jgi:hypothetical protein